MEQHPETGRDSRPRPRLGYQPGLDGLRGIAVATVLFYHAGFSWMAGGYLGVSTFFTLSGFLITSLLLAEYAATGDIHLPSFWERRFRRIMPASFLAILLVTAYGALFADNYQKEHLRGDGLMTLAYSVNWWFILTRRDYADIFGSPSPAQHFWSLAIEEQFYVVFPFLTWFVLRRWKGSHRVFAAVIGLLALASVARMQGLLQTDASAARLYYGTDTRAAELLGGTLLAILLANLSPVVSRVRHFATTALGVAGLLVSAGFWVTLHQEDVFLYERGLGIYTAASMAIVAAAVLPSGPLRALLSWIPLRELGRVSYGVYLYHFPVFLVLTAERTALPEPPLMALRLAVTLVLAQLSYRWVESPIRAGRVVRGWRRYAVPPVALATLIVGLVVVTRDVGGPAAPTRNAASPAADAASSSMAADAPLRVLVIGDSVAANIGEALQRWGATHAGLAVTVEARRGCGIAQGGVETQRDAQLRAMACAGWVKSWPGMIDRVRPKVVLVYSGGWDLLERRLPEWDSPRTIGDAVFDDWLRSQYRESIATLSATGARVVWVSALCAKWRGVSTQGVFDPIRVLRLNRLLVDLIAENGDRASYLDLFSEVCPGQAYADSVHGIENARPDGIHFAQPAGDWVASWIAPRLLEAAP